MHAHRWDGLSAAAGLWAHHAGMGTGVDAGAGVDETPYRNISAGDDAPHYNEKRGQLLPTSTCTRRSRLKYMLFGLIALFLPALVLLALAFLAAVVVIPVYFEVVKLHKYNSNDNSSTSQLTEEGEVVEILGMEAERGVGAERRCERRERDRHPNGQQLRREL